MLLPISVKIVEALRAPEIHLIQREYHALASIMALDEFGRTIIYLDVRLKNNWTLEEIKADLEKKLAPIVAYDSLVSLLIEFVTEHPCLDTLAKR